MLLYVTISKLTVKIHFKDGNMNMSYKQMLHYVRFESLINIHAGYSLVELPILFFIAI